LYKLVEDAKANRYPLWKSVDADIFIYSMNNGRWGIGAHQEKAQGFDTETAYVFNDTPHEGLMPHHLMGGWMHSRPAWTPDEGIKCREVDVSVVLERADEKRKHKVPRQPPKIMQQAAAKQQAVNEAASDDKSDEKLEEELAKKLEV